MSFQSACLLAKEKKRNIRVCLPLFVSEAVMHRRGERSVYEPVVLFLSSEKYNFVFS